MLNQPSETLSGVGPTLSAKLAQCGINTIQDLIFHLPYRYQDRTKITPIKDLRANDWCVVVGHVCKTEITYGKRPMLYCFIEDKTGILRVQFFHFNKQQVKLLNDSKQIKVFGEVREFANNLQITHPDYQLFDDITTCIVEETLTPIYSTTHGLSQTRIRQLVKQALNTYQKEVQALEWMGQEALDNNCFYSIPTAIAHLHNPPPDISVSALETGNHPGLKRLAFDELLAQRLSMQFARKQRDTLKAPSMSAQSDLVENFIKQLPFNLTQAQLRVYQEINDDLTKNKPMLRLVQGDVGSGKTVVAALAAIKTIANGYQVALMAPTDILSEQHMQTLMKWCLPLGITVHRLSGKMGAKQRRITLQALADNTCNLIVGTHALFQNDVHFARLGLIIIDEQHRFGVEQRALLQQKGQNTHENPHQLLMTATPIPRTLSMTQFAHLDISIIDELPPGRTPITTAVLNQVKRDLIIERLEKAIASGRQAYWVCTLIEESEKLQCMAATDSALNLQAQLPNARVGLVHGRLSSAEKEKTMLAFKQGEIDLLVATTVIEVGVDVANASLMIIENAERLGLSQLHQLRGRVGRGSAESHCLLLYQPPLSLQSNERLRVMRATNDGFIIAEKDLQLRGSGEVLGTRQTGYRLFKVANLQRDHELLGEIAKTSSHLIKENSIVAKEIARRWLGDFEHFIIT